jgi:hypothetical protein
VAGSIRASPPDQAGLVRGNPNVMDFTAAPAPDGTCRVAFPRDFLLAMDRLYGGDLYWWIESRDERGQLLFSRMHSFSLLRRKLTLAEP